MRTFRLPPMLLAAAVLVGCGEDSFAPARETHTPAPIGTPGEAPLATYLREVNARLAAGGLPVAAVRAEFSLVGGDPNAPTTVYAGGGLMRRPSRWVHADPRRSKSEELAYGVFTPLSIANGTTDSEPAIDRAADSWRGQACSTLPLVKRTVPEAEIPSLIRGTGYDFLPAVDISHMGFVPNWIFDLVFGGGGSTSVLAVTFTFVWGSREGGGIFVPSDVDGDGRNDTAFKEIWYNDVFTWTEAAVGGGIDIESMALHEIGHALELGHSGRFAIDDGQLRANPRAVMNAFFLGVLRHPLGPDLDVYCGIWEGWGS